jgi:hypothetical protein
MVVLTNRRVPSIVVYNDQQIREVKAFCFNGINGSVLSFDKTYDLEAVYVTPSVYKNKALERKRTSDHPLFLGPLFIHGHSDTETYSRFFGHLSSQLFQSLMIGSDVEQAMRKSALHFFPRATAVVCSRHLKENVGRKLDALLGKQSSTRIELSSAIFGTDGLISCNDVVAFDEHVDRFRAGALATGPAEFREYSKGAS